MIDANPKEFFYKQFYNDMERVYQLLFDEALVKETTVTKSGNSSGSVTHKFLDGRCEEMVINDFEGEEEDINGLNVCKFIFNCKLLREN